MNQPQDQNMMIAPKAPFVVRAVAWIMFVYAVVLFVISLVQRGFVGWGGPLKKIFLVELVIIGLARGIGYFVVATGLMKARRWALYLFTALVALGIIQYFIDPSRNFTIDVVINLIVLVYFWSISRKFV